MKSLDVENLQTGVNQTKSDIENLTEQLQTIEKSVLNFSSLDDELKGQGGEAIRSYYQDCHLPFLEYFQDSLQEFSDVLTQMKEAVDSFESNPSGIVKEEYLESEVKDGFDEVESKTIELTDDANSIIESVHDIVPITKIDESEVIENVRQGKDKVNDVVEELHELDDSQVRALEPILGRIKTMKQYIADLHAKFKSADLSVSSYAPVKIENMKAYNDIQTYLDEKDFAEKQEILKQRNDRPITERVSLESAEKEDNFFISGLKTTGRSIKGGFMGGVDMVVDTATGAYQMVRHPIQTYQSMEHMVLHPVETGKYMSNAVAESFTRDMVNGDAESRSHWVTYTLGTILGTKGAGNAVKSTRVGSNVTKAAKESVKNATNKAGNIQMPNLFPYGPQHQLATVGSVPYNVVDGVNLRDQMMMSAKNFSDKLRPSNYPIPDPPMSMPQVKYKPKKIEEVKRMRQGKGPTTKMTHGDKNIEAHHRQQIPVKDGGILDELEQKVHRGKGNHTRHDKPSQLTPSERAKEIRNHYKDRGKEYILPGEGI